MHLKSRKEEGSEVSPMHSPPDCQVPALRSSLFKVWLWLFICNVGGLLGSRINLDSLEPSAAFLWVQDPARCWPPARHLGKSY